MLDNTVATWNDLQKLRNQPNLITMKTVLFRLVVLTGTVALLSSARASLFEYDGFDYSGTALATQNGGTGWNGAWFTTASSQPNSLSNDGISLSYPMSWETPLNPLTSTGSRVDTGGLSANASTTRVLTQTIPLNVDGTVAYVSAL